MRHLRANLVLLALALASTGLLASCTKSSSIQEILVNCAPKRFEHVSISATVVKTLSLPYADLYGYKLGDDNATIWTLAKFSNPPEGAEITVQATAYPVSYFKKMCEQKEGDSLECGAYAQGLKFIAGECLLIEEKRE